MTIVYELISANPHDTFDAAEPWSGELHGWRCVLEGRRLTATADNVVGTDPAARAALEEALRAWAAVAYLRGQYEIRFRPLETGASDVDPFAANGAHGDSADRAAPPREREHVFRRANSTYPSPDPSFTRTALARKLLAINRRFADRRQDLPSAISELVAALRDALPATGDESLEQAYNIDPVVTRALIELAGRGPVRPDSAQPTYRGPEWQWMQEALRLVTLQAGRRTSSAPESRLSADDFRARL